MEFRKYSLKKRQIFNVSFEKFDNIELCASLSLSHNSRISRLPVTGNNVISTVDEVLKLNFVRFIGALSFFFIFLYCEHIFPPADALQLPARYRSYRV